MWNRRIPLEGSNDRTGLDMDLGLDGGLATSDRKKRG